MADGARTAFVGVADHVPAKGETIGYWELHADLARRALADAGMSHKDVDGVVFTRSGYPMPKPVFPTTFCEHLGLSPAWMELCPHGGAQMASAVWRAASAIQSGLASTVLITSADNRESRFSRSGVVARIADQNMDPEFETPYGPMFITNFALMAARYMHEYGTTSEDFAQVAVTQRTWAASHPTARMRKPLTVEDVVGSRMISSPLHLFDICLVTDGGVALVMTRADLAADRPHPPVWLRGFGDVAESQNITYLSDLTRPVLYRKAAEQAYAMAGITPADVDLAYPYDPTTSFALWGLEELGLAERGEARELVASGATSAGGRLPVNTHGGLLSYGHPGVPGALLGVCEAVHQLRGTAGDRQVENAHVAVASSIGGFLACGVNVLGTEPA
jgi:acetyl-CoA acetyltransferase